MTKDIYTPWEPLEGLSGRMLVEKLEDTNKGLAIYLNLLNDPENRQLKILFDPYIAYRNMDESYRAKTFSEKGGFKNSLNIVCSSTWIDWLHDESLGYYKNSDIVHYTIITAADCIDVLSEFPPQVD